MENENSAIYQEVQALLGDLPQHRTQLLPLLWRVAEHQGRISRQAMEAIAVVLNVPVADVFGVASFYTLFEDVGENVPVYICTDVMCALAGAEQLKETAEHSAVNRPVAVKESACLGQCDHAPAAWIKGKVFKRATAEEIEAAIKEVRHE
jgi:NADH:ubiquinone oxidoreductase subunit E